LTLVGLTSLLVGGVGVGNAVNAFVAEKLRTIATLKCLGAPGRLVFRAYLLQVMALTLVGVAVGVAIGAAVPFLLAGPLNALLPVSFTPFFHPAGLVMAGLFGLFTALAFSLWPIGRARETAAVDLFRDLIAPRARRPRAIYIIATVLSAAGLAALALFSAEDLWFSGWFVAGALIVLLIFRLIGMLVVDIARRLRKIRRPALRLAVANMHRPGNATGNVILSLGLGLTVLVSIALIEGNFSRALLEDIPEDAPAFFFIDVQTDELEAFSTTLGQVDGARNLIVTPMARGALARVNGIPAADALKDPSHSWVMRGDRGLTYTAEVPENSRIIQGEWWPADYRGKPLLSIANDVAQAFDIGVVREVTALNRIAQIVQDFSNTRHADAADSDEMDGADGKRHLSHAMASFGGPGLSAVAPPALSPISSQTRSANRSAASSTPTRSAHSAARCSFSGDSSSDRINSDRELAVTSLCGISHPPPASHSRAAFSR